MTFGAKSDPVDINLHTTFKSSFLNQFTMNLYIFSLIRIMPDSPISRPLQCRVTSSYRLSVMDQMLQRPINASIVTEAGLVNT